MKEQKKDPVKMRIIVDASLANVDLSPITSEKQARAHERLRNIKLPETHQNAKRDY